MVVLLQVVVLVQSLHQVVLQQVVLQVVVQSQQLQLQLGRLQGHRHWHPMRTSLASRWTSVACSTTACRPCRWMHAAGQWTQAPCSQWQSR